ncbi:MAG: DUF3261 domain-containing protein [Rhodoferax sp.]|nr:DUF3261 domain-containing protein [Rhodoferax sp.]
MNAFKHQWFAAAVLSVLAACAMPPVVERAPLLKLTPASLGRELSMSQQMQVQAAGQNVVMDVALEADASAVRMAVLQFGRTLARLEWDGQQLSRTLAPGWPDSLLAERVLNDLQLVWWPASVVRGALPSGWSLAESVDSRTLLHEGRVVIEIELPRAGTIVIRHPLDGYTVQVRTDGQSPNFESNEDQR